jgi:hypothetical protein
MAARGRRGTRASGRSDRSPWPPVAAASEPASGATTTAPARQRRRTASVPSTTILTGPTYRRLILGGLAPAEAANLTAFLCGLPVGASPWRLREVNQLLFLRELHRSGRFATDASASRGSAAGRPSVGRPT